MQSVAKTGSLQGEEVSLDNVVNKAKPCTRQTVSLVERAGEDKHRVFYKHYKALARLMDIALHSHETFPIDLWGTFNESQIVLEKQNSCDFFQSVGWYNNPCYISLVPHPTIPFSKLTADNAYVRNSVCTNLPREVASSLTDSVRRRTCTSLANAVAQDRFMSDMENKIAAELAARTAEYEERRIKAATAESSVGTPRSSGDEPTKHGSPIPVAEIGLDSLLAGVYDSHSKHGTRKTVKCGVGIVQQLEGIDLSGSKGFLLRERILAKAAKNSDVSKSWLLSENNPLSAHHISMNWDDRTTLWEADKNKVHAKAATAACGPIEFDLTGDNYIVKSPFVAQYEAIMSNPTHTRIGSSQWFRYHEDGDVNNEVHFAKIRNGQVVSLQSSEPYDSDLDNSEEEGPASKVDKKPAVPLKLVDTAAVECAPKVATTGSASSSNVSAPKAVTAESTPSASVSAPTGHTTSAASSRATSPDEEVNPDFGEFADGVF